MVICIGHIGHIGIDTMIQTSVYKNDEWCYLNGEYIMMVYDSDRMSI